MHVSTHADAHPHYTQKSKETVCQLILSNLYFYVLLSKTNKPTKQNKTKNQQPPISQGVPCAAVGKENPRPPERQQSDVQTQVIA